MLDEVNPYLDRRVDQDRNGGAIRKSVPMTARNKMASSKLYRNRAKRLLGIICTLIIMPLYLPLMLIIAVLVSVGEGPVLFRSLPHWRGK